MVDQRLFHKDILQSSLYYQLGEDFPGRELHAQRLFETLILLADDYGRGRFMPSDLRTRGFSSARVAFAEVSLEDIEEWMGTIEENGAAYRYEIGNERYYFLPKWFEYQTLKYRKKSHIPNPPNELLSNMDLFLSNSGEILPLKEKNTSLEDKSVENQDNSNDVKKGKVKKSKEGKKEEKDNTEKPDHNERIITDCYQQNHIQHFGNKPNWIFPADGKHIKDILKYFTAEQITSAINFIFANENDWWTENLAVFRSITSTKCITKALGEITISKPTVSKPQYCCPKCGELYHDVNDKCHVGKDCELEEVIPLAEYKRRKATISAQ